MIPLSIFLIVWLVFLAVFLFISALSIMQMLRFGLHGPITRWTTIIYIVVSVGIIVISLVLLSGLDLNATIDITNSLGDVLLVN
ncbi:hypothetical protein KKG46_01265 [Patescibacteria group bacterium]|nr:hypothetical protein [Patescibacteria group bacterium]